MLALLRFCAFAFLALLLLLGLHLWEEWKGKRGLAGGFLARICACISCVYYDTYHLPFAVALSQLGGWPTGLFTRNIWVVYSTR